MWNLNQRIWKSKKRNQRSNSLTNLSQNATQIFFHPLANQPRQALKMRFLEVTKHDETNMTPVQQALLLSTLVKIHNVFKGGCGYYNGAPVSVKLMDNAKPYCTKPNPIPLRNWEVMEHKLAQQCLIG
jgi:hypothetical protein